MVNVVLDNDDLTVLGGPSKVNVDISIGATGRRGTFVFAGVQNPRFQDPILFEDPIVGDLYILINPADDEYLTMFQYLNVENQTIWTPVISLSLQFYNTGRTVFFNNGVGEIQVNIFALGFGRNIPLPPLLNSRLIFSVQATPVTDRPVALSVDVQDLKSISTDSLAGEEDLITYLPIKVHAAEFENESWQSVNGKTIPINLAITLKNPNDLLLGLIDTGEES